ncbi:ABC transporter substrate-binding protein [Pacificibacter marinus]|uniref:ABC transporter substrate-binding protein n=1 Tax=Pacificibacter marinus TaxID=658057 RepID=UPI001C073F37|nr:ABC transporter substrate-binding protein [Pacificibacter marinus]MBU2865512.1 ABC transporter substrate-binding protein [Pacificibacter marinus]
MKHLQLALAGALAASLAVPAFAGKSDDTLNWATDKEIAVIDPYFSVTRELVIMGQMGWDGLVLFNSETGEFDPLLAKSWTWDGNMAVEFKLREDVVFHDGSTFDADDVVYTINFLLDEENGVPAASIYNWMKSAEKIDDYTVRIELNAPSPLAFSYLSNEISIMPSGHYDNAPTGADGSKDYSSVPPVGTGPYMVADSQTGKSILWKRNDAYFEGGPKGTPEIGNIRYRTISESNTQLAELLTGGLDWIWDVPKEQALRMEDSGQVSVVNEKTLRISYMAFDVDGDSGQDFFTDKRVRQAVSHAINREAIAIELVGPASTVIHSACHPDQFGCTQDVKQYDYDPDKARALLIEAGYPAGFEFDLYGYRQREFTEAVIGDLAAVGIRANLNWMQYGSLLDLTHKGKTPINHMTWGSGSIPDVGAITPHFFSGGADDPAKDPRTAEALARGDTSVDSAVRKEAYAEALGIIAEEAYWLPMFTYAKYYAFSKDLNFTPTSDEIPRFFEATWN